MLRYLTLANWKSIHEPIEFSMVATNERRHGERLARVGRTRILPITAIYGANAAGKSTLTEGLAALQDIITKPRTKGEPLPLIPHKLLGRGKPTMFGIEFVVAAPESKPGRQDWVFYYEVTADRQRIHTESLARLRSGDEEVLFERQETNVDFFGDLAEDSAAKAVKRLLSPNQTVLGILGDVDAAPEVISSARAWFSDHLRIIRPHADFLMLPAWIAGDQPFADAMNHALSTSDTGISKIVLEEFTPSSALPIDVIEELTNDLERTQGVVVLTGFYGEYGLASLHDDGSLKTERLVTVHEGKIGEDGRVTDKFTLPLAEESDGTARFINLLPMLFLLSKDGSRAVFVVDELENSMHPLLTVELIQDFLTDLSSDDRRQLIFTTHELQLMHAHLLRRDEFWLADKVSVETQMTRVSDFSREGVRKDADFPGIYVSGRLGGVPQI
jgi:putative abortive phage resistance protein